MSDLLAVQEMYITVWWALQEIKKMILVQEYSGDAFRKQRLPQNNHISMTSHLYRANKTWVQHPPWCHSTAENTLLFRTRKGKNVALSRPAALASNNAHSVRHSLKESYANLGTGKQYNSASSYKHILRRIFSLFRIALIYTSTV